MTLAMMGQAIGSYAALFAFSAFAFWRPNVILFMILSGIAMLTGLNTPDMLSGDTTTPMTMGLGLVLVLYSFLCLAYAYRMMLATENEE